MNAVRLRWIAKKAGIERIYLREKRFTGYFIQNPESDYFGSPVFTAVLQFIRDYPGNCRMKENNDKLSLIIQHIGTISEALRALAPLDKLLSGNN